MNHDQQEIDKFQELANQWWDPQGPLKSLHDINPIRLSWITEQCELNNKRVLDVGCGGGILTESLALSGAQATGLDLAKPLIDTAKLHALEHKVSVDYHCIDVGDFAKQHAGEFDVVTCMELLEHVPDPASLIQHCSNLLKPGGHIVFSTINRNPKAYLFAIVAGEYVLRLLPKGTHDYKQFIKPAELDAWCRQADLKIDKFHGMSYRPLQKRYYLCDDISVNYLAAAKKAG
ncbi:MAG: bifunctional 3-demethylubiquinol 3-O-methyltransferase/2-polyprenyl-6-hydroxyphenol methylase [Legionellaceae bacterium]|nr:bifunctional 3-demethylubiquinol 3-O-methyltransferase/2-polyprenyl-6-hydroxyphenol methylase [Legionellaceae bacterium]|tara:strand:- start:2054 stop:2749 length:696 start_codon:yes stop_codon:yes gene_type:complete